MEKEATKEFERLQKEALQARKNKETEKATLLTTVLSQIKTKAIDDGHRAANDNDVILTVRQFLKSTNENIALAKKSGVAENDEKIKAFEAEKNILETYLPQQMSEQELREIIGNLGANNIGEAMKALKEKYNGRYDGKLASQIVKEVLA